MAGPTAEKLHTWYQVSDWIKKKKCIFSCKDFVFLVPAASATTAPIVLLEFELEQYAAVQEQQQQANVCCSNRVLLECYWLLLLVLLQLSARVLVTAWPQDVGTHCIHHVHTW